MPPDGRKKNKKSTGTPPKKPAGRSATSSGRSRGRGAGRGRGGRGGGGRKALAAATSSDHDESVETPSPKPKKSSPTSSKKVAPKTKAGKKAEPEAAGGEAAGSTQPKKRIRLSDEDKSFAKRPKPKTPDALDQWQAIRDTFNSKIYFKVASPSSHQAPVFQLETHMHDSSPVQCSSRLALLLHCASFTLSYRTPSGRL